VGAAKGQQGAARAKINPKPWEGEPSYEMGCGDPVGAHREGPIPPDQRLASRAGVHATCTPSHGRTKREGTRKQAAGWSPARGRVGVPRIILTW
jgi:hypothetical protein